MTDGEPKFGIFAGIPRKVNNSAAHDTNVQNKLSLAFPEGVYLLTLETVLLASTASFTSVYCSGNRQPFAYY